MAYILLSYPNSYKIFLRLIRRYWLIQGGKGGGTGNSGKAGDRTREPSVLSCGV